IGPNGEPDPTIIRTVPRPDFFFLWLFSIFALLPPWAERALILVAPVRVSGILFGLPFISGTGEKSFRRRPVSVIVVVVVATAIGTLTWLGTWSPWSPVMDAWSAAPTPPAYVRNRSPLELQGALLVQSKQCRNCHALGGEGGRRGTARDLPAARRRGRGARPGARRYTAPPHAGRAGTTGLARRWKHARLRKEPE